MPLFLLITTLSFILSLTAAVVAETHLSERIAIIGDVLGLQLSHNSGIAFGVQLPPILQELLIAAALVAVCILAWKSPPMRRSHIGYGLIVGGALGNIVDRLLDGLVTDFIRIGSFPIFNIADSCITIGVVFVLASTLQLGRNNPQ